MSTESHGTDGPEIVALSRKAVDNFAKVVREKVVILDIELDAAPGSLSRLWHTLNLHAVVPLSLEIRTTPPVIEVAISMETAGSREQRILLDALSRIMVVRRSNFRSLKTQVAIGPSDNSPSEPATGNRSDIAARRRFFPLFKK